MRSTTTTTLTSPRNGNLDCLRALAIALVVVFHIEGYAPFPSVLQFVRGWWCGVDLFFVLSGYLIGGLALREIMRDDSLRVGHFLARRWWRTIPPYVIALVAVYTIEVLVLKAGRSFHWQYLVFLQNYAFAGDLPYFGVSWTLCVEEQFYLLLPLLLVGVNRRHLRLAVHVIALACILIPLISRVSVAASPLQRTWEYATHHYCAGLGIGVWLAWVQTRDYVLGRRQRFAIGMAAPVALGYMLFYDWLPFTPWAEFVFGRMSLVLACGMLIYAAITLGPWWGSSTWVVRSLALSSYSIYLTHVPVIATLARTRAIVPLPLLTVGAILFSLIVGAAFWWLVERPALWLRERFAPQQDQTDEGTSRSSRWLGSEGQRLSAAAR
jgi:peptidoglycan/LPS O-acetylase OafA/YrhL